MNDTNYDNWKLSEPPEDNLCNNCEENEREKNSDYCESCNESSWLANQEAR